MGNSDLEAEYKYSFTERVKSARIAAGMKQWQIASAIGVPQDKYKQYEGRSLLPHYLIGRFCIVTRVDPEWLVTGHGPKPLKPLQVAATEPEPVAKPKHRRKKQRAA